MNKHGILKIKRKSKQENQTKNDDCFFNSSFISNLIKSTNINDLDYFYICYAKINQLIQIKVRCFVKFKFEKLILFYYF